MTDRNDSQGEAAIELEAMLLDRMRDGWIKPGELAHFTLDAIRAGKIPGIALKTYDGTTCWACEKCGKTRSGRGCMACLERDPLSREAEVAELRKERDEARAHRDHYVTELSISRARLTGKLHALDNGFKEADEVDVAALLSDRDRLAEEAAKAKLSLTKCEDEIGDLQEEVDALAEESDGFKSALTQISTLSAPECGLAPGIARKALL